ncbi:hypothetical protein LK10_08925 [Sinomonas humi]|uniref:Uncharacterized protein n=1 Tax=Sinomonas humi TaxID=1338436 RepID=A0A0B2AJL7_9MICC|nr:hypothetical protein LK10_08925 [Sinomonas humi]
MSDHQQVGIHRRRSSFLDRDGKRGGGSMMGVAGRREERAVRPRQRSEEEMQRLLQDTTA